MKHQTLTPALAHRMGEGEWFTVYCKNRPVSCRMIIRKPKMNSGYPLAHRMGEGQGEGIF